MKYKILKKEQRQIQKQLHRLLNKHQLLPLFELFFQAQYPLYLVGGLLRDQVLAYLRRKKCRKKYQLNPWKYRPGNFKSLQSLRKIKIYSVVRDIDFSCQAPWQVSETLCRQYQKNFPHLLGEDKLNIHTHYQSVGFTLKVQQNRFCSVKMTRNRSEAHLYKTSYLSGMYFTKDLKWDAERRDFKCNALYYAPPEYFKKLKKRKIWYRSGHRKGLFSPLQKEACYLILEELSAQKLTFIGLDFKRIRQDSLRFLRALRLSRSLCLKLSEDFLNIELPFSKKDFSSKFFQREWTLLASYLQEGDLTWQEKQVKKAYDDFLKSKAARKTKKINF